MSNATYATTRGRRIASMVLGALLGGAATAVPSILLVNERGHLSVAGVFGGVITSIVGWLLGIVVLGLPVWWLVEAKWGPRRGAALLCGASLPPLWVLLFMKLVQSWGRSPTRDTSFTIGIVEVVVGIPSCARARTSS